MKGFRIIIFVFPHLREECRVSIINAFIAEFRYHVFDWKYQYLSEPAHVTFRGVFKPQVKYVQYFYVRQMWRCMYGSNIYGR